MYISLKLTNTFERERERAEIVWHATSVVSYYSKKKIFFLNMQESCISFKKNIKK
jgi:hypothetical protein